MQQDSRIIVLDAVREMASPVTEQDVVNYLKSRGINLSSATIEAELRAGTVNNDSRLYYSPDISPPPLNSRDRDLFYRLKSGSIVLYDPERHGLWEIYTSGSGRPRVRRREACVGPSDVSPESQPFKDRAYRERFLTACDEPFMSETQLQVHISRNLELLEPELKLFSGPDGVSGFEYITPIGRVDLLAVDKDGGFVVIELKVSKGPDSVAGQVLRYKNWIKRHVADGRRVRGWIIAHQISDQIKYAIADDPELEAFEYKLSLAVFPVDRTVDVSPGVDGYSVAPE